MIRGARASSREDGTAASTSARKLGAQADTDPMPNPVAPPAENATEVAPMSPMVGRPSAPATAKPSMPTGGKSDLSAVYAGVISGTARAIGVEAGGRWKAPASEEQQYLPPRPVNPKTKTQPGEQAVVVRPSVIEPIAQASNPRTGAQHAGRTQRDTLTAVPDLGVTGRRRGWLVAACIAIGGTAIGIRFVTQSTAPIVAPPPPPSEAARTNPQPLPARAAADIPAPPPSAEPTSEPPSREPNANANVQPQTKTSPRSPSSRGPRSSPPSRANGAHDFPQPEPSASGRYSNMYDQERWH